MLRCILAAPHQAALIASDEVEVRRAVTTATGRLFEGADPCHRQSRSRVVLAGQHPDLDGPGTATAL